MDEDKKQIEKAAKDPSIVTGVFVFNKKGEILLIRAPKWEGMLTLPGGHLDVGESLEESVVREVKEETGLDVKNIEFVKIDEFINHKKFVKGLRHLVAITYKAEVSDEGQEIVLNEEGTEYFWFKPEEAVKRDDIGEHNIETIKNNFIKKDKKKMFSKKCSNCEKAKQEMEECKIGWQRALADYKNLQRETEEKRGEWVRYSKQQILEDFIPVYNNFTKAMEHADANDSANKTLENWAKGIEYIMKQFGGVLKNHGIEEIKTVGEEFNPERHEAVGEEESDEVESGKILREVEAGYVMSGRVVKVAKVVVAK